MINRKQNSEVNGLAVFKQAMWYPIIGLAVAISVPESFVFESELLRHVVQEAALWIPAIDNLSAVSDFPALTGLYLAVMWALLPFVVCWWIWRLMRSRKKVEAFPSTKLLLSGLAGIPLAIALVLSTIYWFPYYPDEQQLTLHAGRSGAFLGVITHFRLGLGLWLGAFFYVLAFFVMAWLLFIWLYVSKLFRSLGISP